MKLQPASHLLLRCCNRNCLMKRCTCACLSWPGMTERLLCRPCQRAVDHRHRILQSVDRDKRAEARAFFLAEQHLIGHVEPDERKTRTALPSPHQQVQERLHMAYQGLL